jgi:hypothetical protein
MSKIELDEIDIGLLEEINQNPGQPLSSAMAVALDCREQRTLYDRLIALEAQKYISVDRVVEKGRSLATITPKGKAAIKGKGGSYLLVGGVLMSGSLAAPLSTFSADSAKPAVPILPDGFSLGGWLEQLEAVGGGLVRVVVSDREYLVDDSLQEELTTMMGQHMSVGHYFGQWGCGVIPA